MTFGLCSIKLAFQIFASCDHPAHQESIKKHGKPDLLSYEIGGSEMKTIQRVVEKITNVIWDPLSQGILVRGCLAQLAPEIYL